MNEARRAIARIVEQHLDEIVDRTLRAYIAEIPAVAAASHVDLRRVRESTKRTTLAFIAVYADPSSPARIALEGARRVTLDRAGEPFEREDILAMIRIGRHVVYRSAREFVRSALKVDPALVGEIDTALEAFLDELARPEEVLPHDDDALYHLLASAENEDPDLQ